MVVDTRKAIALLAYLVVSGPAVTRDRAAALLWPEHDHAHARGALRRTLSTLRRAIGDEHLEASRQQIELLPAGLDVDVLRFEDLAAADDPASLREAWGRYRGDLLLGFGLRDSAEFDDWQRREADRLRAVAVDVLERLSRHSERRGELAEAVEHAESWLRLDPLSEPAHRRLIELEASRGDRAAAVRRYRALVRKLDDELGVEPLDETTAVYEAVRRGGAPPQRPAEAAAVIEPPLPVHGRDAELDAVVAAIPRSRRHGHLVLIEGNAGMGTTRLAHEAADRLRRSGAVVATVRCHAHEAELGYASVISLVRALLGGRRAADLDLPHASAAQVAGLVPELATTPTPPPGQLRLFEALTDVILGLARGAGPPILVLDDLHRIDPAGGSYLRFLANRLDTIPIAIVATVHPDEGDAAEPMMLLARDLRERATIVQIDALTEDDTARLVAAAGCHQVDPAELWRATGGIPLYLAEYLKSGCAEALLDGAVPEGLHPILAARLDGLGAAASQTFTAVSVLAEPADIDLVRRVAGRSIDEAADAIDVLVGAGMLIRDQLGRYSPANVLTARVAYDRVGLERRRLLHHRAAVALEGDPGRAAATARHYRAAGDREAAARCFAAAGDDARGVFANDTAWEHYQAALDLGSPAADRLREAIADLATAAGRYSEAHRHYELVAATCAGTDLARVEQKLGQLHLRIGDPEIAISHFQSALAEIEDDDAPALARLLADLAAAHSSAGNIDEATATIGAAATAAGRADGPAARAAVENIRGLIAGRHGDEVVAREAFELSLHLAEIDGDAGAMVAASNNLALALTRAGEHHRARELFQSALGLAVRTGEEHRAAAIHSNLADLYHDAGDPVAAAAHIRQMAELMAEIGAQFDEPKPGVWMQTAW